MVETIFVEGFFDYLKIFFVAILIYAIVFAMLKSIKIFGEGSKIDSLVALIAAIIVSFSGAVTYAVSYAINWFVILLFIIFLLLVILLFLGVKPDQIASAATNNGKIIVGVFILLFLIILLKGFFAVNNAYDINNPQNDPYKIDPSFNTGADDIILEEDEEFNTNFNINYNNEMMGVAGFLLIIGIFIFMIGR